MFAVLFGALFAAAVAQPELSLSHLRYSCFPPWPWPFQTSTPSKERKEKERRLYVPRTRLAFVPARADVRTNRFLKSAAQGSPTSTLPLMSCHRVARESAQSKNVRMSSAVGRSRRAFSAYATTHVPLLSCISIPSHTTQSRARFVSHLPSPISHPVLTQTTKPKVGGFGWSAAVRQAFVTYVHLWNPVQAYS